MHLCLSWKWVSSSERETGHPGQRNVHRDVTLKQRTVIEKTTAETVTVYYINFLHSIQLLKILQKICLLWLVASWWHERQGSSWQCPRSSYTRLPYLWWPEAASACTCMCNTCEWRQLLHIEFRIMTTV